MSRSITIGRNPQSTIRISEDYDIVSNDHAEIIQQGVELTFTDHSSNGTIINGQKIQRDDAKIKGHPSRILLRNKIPKNAVNTESSKLKLWSPVVPGNPKNSLNA